jgi:hypothetical protein
MQMPIPPTLQQIALNGLETTLAEIDSLISGA